MVVANIYIFRYAFVVFDTLVVHDFVTGSDQNTTKILNGAAMFSLYLCQHRLAHTTINSR